MNSVPSARSTRLLWCALGAALLIFFALFTQKFLGFPLHRSLLLTRLEPGPNGVAHAVLPKNWRVGNWSQRFLRIDEDGVALPYRIPSSDGVPEQGNGCYQVRGDLLWFAGIDGSDPLKNHRQYRLTAAVPVPGRLLWAAAGAALAVGMCLSFSSTARSQRRRAVSAAWRWICTPMSPPSSPSTPPRAGAGWPDRVCGLISRNLAVLLAIPSLFIVMGLPPLWKDVDAVIQVTFEANQGTVLHFPPFYCFSARLPVVAGEIAGWIFAHGPKPEWKFWRMMKPTAAGIYGLVLTQHLLLWIYLAAFIRTCTASPRIQVLLAALAMSWAPFYLLANSIGSETGSMLCILLLCIVCIRLLTPGAPRYFWFFYTAALYCCVTTRHVNAVLAMIMPAALAIRAVPGLLFQRGEVWSGTLKRSGAAIFIATVAGMLSLVAGNLTLRGLALVLQIDYQSDLGATLADPVVAFLRHLPPGERQRVEAGVLARVASPAERQAAGALAEIGEFNGPGGYVVRVWLARHERLPWQPADEEARKAFSAASLLYVKTAHPELVRQIISHFREGIFEDTSTLLAGSTIAAYTWAIDHYAEHWERDLWQGLDRYPYFTAAEEEQVTKWYACPYLELYNWLTPCVILVAGAFLAAISLYRRPARVGLVSLVFALQVTGILLFLLNTTLGLPEVRYAMPLFLLGIAALFLSLSLVLEPKAPAAMHVRE